MSFPFLFSSKQSYDCDLIHKWNNLYTLNHLPTIKYHKILSWQLITKEKDAENIGIKGFQRNHLLYFYIFPLFLNILFVSMILSYFFSFFVCSFFFLLLLLSLLGNSRTWRCTRFSRTTSEFDFLRVSRLYTYIFLQGGWGRLSCARRITQLTWLTKLDCRVLPSLALNSTSQFAHLPNVLESHHILDFICIYLSWGKSFLNFRFTH